MTMRIGSLNSDEALGKRDAIHVPVVLVESDDPLYGGLHVQFVDNDFNKVTPCIPQVSHAVVDPFIDRVSPGEKVWVMLQPESIGGLTHQYDINIKGLPQGEASLQAEDDEEWLSNSCRGCY